MQQPTVLIVPGLRDAVAQHWQTLLQQDLQQQGKAVQAVPAMGREQLDCGARVQALEDAVRAIGGPVVLVAHSGGVITVAHWARHSQHAIHAVHAALLVVPPDFQTPMPAGYPSLADLDAAGWLPVPRHKLPFRSLVCVSQNDPLAALARAQQLASDWGADQRDLGAVGHLNPASGFGPWPLAQALLAELSAH